MLTVSSSPSWFVRRAAIYTRTLDKAGVPLDPSQIIPNRGAWLEYEMDSNDIIWVRLYRARKLCLTTLLRALGYETDDDIHLLGNDKRRASDDGEGHHRGGASKDCGGAVRTLREQAPPHPLTRSRSRTSPNPSRARRTCSSRCSTIPEALRRHARGPLQVQ